MTYNNQRISRISILNISEEEIRMGPIRIRDNTPLAEVMVGRSITAMVVANEEFTHLINQYH